MQRVQLQSQAILHEKVSSSFEQSLTEEQRFLQGVMSGDIKLVPHEEVMKKLEFVLKNGLQHQCKIEPFG